MLNKTKLDTLLQEHNQDTWPVASKLLDNACYAATGMNLADLPDTAEIYEMRCQLDGELTAYVENSKPSRFESLCACYKEMQSDFSNLDTFKELFF